MTHDNRKIVENGKEIYRALVLYVDMDEERKLKPISQYSAGGHVMCPFGLCHYSAWKEKEWKEKGEEERDIGSVREKEKERWIFVWLKMYLFVDIFGF